MNSVFVAPILKEDRHKSEFHLIYNNWKKFFKLINLQVNSYFDLSEEGVKSIERRNKALILCGGGEINKIKKDKLNLKRDNFEKKLISIFLKKKKPILAICRGFQLIASLNSGKFAKSKNHVRKTHNLIISKESKFILCKKLITNSFHNNVIKSISKEFDVIARSKDFYIEIAENKKQNIICFMFHPEKYNKSNNQIKTIVNNFINGSINISSRKR